ncbi:LPXTG-motif surface-anchored protein [Staphylococcus petrasii]|uniref:LPXTG cell wall anchor domain-containing protein n=1 Tax=Staphylococcus petrasii TaxID=1276936 RepID=A0A380G0E5_9STAP|nr:LPXTG cell wall anchor domain-containing protein [Staphylococcus petrasii]PNZ25315.1 cell wall anchor protein [Staphylococcus petrasii]TGE12710.1 LPXTG cell wall anchor domain-containing protein [Staphylococcus petrasii]TGE17435.1 LPXTG cell wall anchor domain-containing protein [Staphylococcus petrasii]SUM43966.1 LPXTG-motif surface-anchored protein [Staphylococcus petrasii]
MKKVNLLGATTLAGALLFTGFGQANASEQINVNNAKDIAIKASLNKEAREHSFSPGLSSDLEYNTSYTTTKKDNDYIISSPKENAYTYRLTEDGKLYFMDKINGKEYYISRENVNNAPQTSQSNQPSDKNTTTQNTTDNNESNQNTKQQTTKALPETGEQSNSGLVTIIASVLLAAGSLLTFKRFSNNK